MFLIILSNLSVYVKWGILLMLNSEHIIIIMSDKGNTVLAVVIYRHVVTLYNA